MIRPLITVATTGKTYITQMAPKAAHSDHWIASVLSYVRNSFGNQASFVTAKDVSRICKATDGRATPRTREEVRAFEAAPAHEKQSSRTK